MPYPMHEQVRATLVGFNVRLLNVPLDAPFELGFGTLITLPRVLVSVTGETDTGRRVTGWGEASIDFPFVDYDMWDVYVALSSIPLTSCEIELPLQDFTGIMQLMGPHIFDALTQFPSAVAALTMALDDLAGHALGVAVSALCRKFRTFGSAVQSFSPIGLSSTSIGSMLSRIADDGFVPKVKLGFGVQDDCAIIKAAASDYGGAILFDYNGSCEVEEFGGSLALLAPSFNTFQSVLVEQPCPGEAGASGLLECIRLARDFDLPVAIVGDEGVAGAESAKELARAGGVVNIKVQKFGGRLVCQEIDEAVLGVTDGGAKAFVGGTFPTVFGRAYDQHVACVLESAVLPGDGWMPSAWFRDERHFAVEYPWDSILHGRVMPPAGAGLGLTPQMDRIRKYLVRDPEDAYRRLRSDEPSEIRLQLRAAKSYRSEYEARNVRPFDWNL